MLKTLYYMLYLKFIIEFIICDIWIKFCGDFYSGRISDLARSRNFKIFVAIYGSSKIFYGDINFDLTRSRKFKNFMAIYGSSILLPKFPQNKLLFSLSFRNKTNNLWSIFTIWIKNKKKCLTFFQMCYIIVICKRERITT